MPLGTVPDELVLEHDALAGRLQREHEVERGARYFHVVEGDAPEDQPLEPARIEDGVVAVAFGVDVCVGASETFEAVVAGATVEDIGDLEAVDHIVARRPCDVDIVLKELQPGPLGPVAEHEPLDHVDVADERYAVEEILEDQRILGALNAQGERLGRTLTLEGKIGPAQVVREDDHVVGRTQSLEGHVAVAHDVAAVVPTVDIGIAALAAGQQVVARAAVERLFHESAIDDVVAIGLGALQHAARDLLEVDGGAVVEDEALDQVRREVLDAPGIGHEVGKKSQIKTDAVEHPLDQDRVASRVAVVVE